MNPCTALLVIGLGAATMLSWLFPRLHSEPSRYDLAQQFMQLGQPEKATHLFEMPAWRGVAQYRAGRYRRALAEFIQEESIANLYNMGNAYARLHEWVGAIAAYETALRLDPAHENARFNLTLVLRAQALEQQLLEDSRNSKARGQWQDGNRQLPTPDVIETDNTQEGQPDGGAFRLTTADATASGKSDISGQDERQPGNDNPQAGISAGAAQDNATDSRLTGSSASMQHLQSAQDAEILLRRIEDRPAHVLRARLKAAYQSRLQLPGSSRQ